MQSRRNTFELFGYDFMVDKEYKVWLIEVNSSPTMEHSTKVTTDLVRRGLSDLADLVNHYYFGAKHVFNSPSYGGWKLIQH